MEYTLQPSPGVKTGNTFETGVRGSWTPVLTFSDPGDLSVVYNASIPKFGVYFRNRSVITALWSVYTSTFTHSTATGFLTVTGLPYAAAVPYAGEGVTSGSFMGSLGFSGITKAGYTQITPYVAAGQQNILFNASGSGQSISTVGVADVPSGAAYPDTPILAGTLTYIIE